jgi:hypothetical protein
MNKGGADRTVAMRQPSVQPPQPAPARAGKVSPTLILLVAGLILLLVILLVVFFLTR